MLRQLLIGILVGCVLDNVAFVNADYGKGNDISSSLTLSCKDEDGNNVEWFIAYKLPTIPHSEDPLFKQGSGYFYLLPGKNVWERSKLGINEPQSILGVTTSPIFNNSSRDLAYFLYNDQPPSLPAVVRDGHTKGIVFSNSQGGVWLPHSCPHFIASGSSFTYPTGGLENGQMFMCLSLDVAQIDEIGDILKYTKPKVYDFSVSENMKALVPTLLDVAQNKTVIKIAPWYKTFPLTVKGLSPMVFAKGPKFHRDIYSSWISQKYKTSLDVQSWMNGAHPLQSDCSSGYSTLNVLEKIIAGQNFSTSDDHSKWAVGLDPSIPLTCVGDLNRMKPQKGRGGVAVCILNKDIWSSFNATVANVQSCNETAHHFQVTKKLRKGFRG